ncbi:MAG: sugar-binding transcriptional regulator [Anaerolineae bacterium]|nr:sugar-binding transcriptional regulator [Anaerolineae bacterium]
MNQRTTLLLEVAHAYYENGYTQQEIAQMLGLSRSQVSRYLSEAREVGIVQIRIVSPDARVNHAEDALKARFANLREAVVTPLFATQPPVVLKSIGRACAEYLCEHIAPGQRVCIGSGRTLRETVRWLRPHPVENVTVVQAMGALGHEASDIDFNELARLAAQALGARVSYLNAPAVLGSGAAAELAAANPSIAESLRLAHSADVYVVGVGCPAVDHVYVRAGIVTAQELNAVEQHGAVGDICGRFFDIQGAAMPSSFDDRVVGIELEDLRRALLSIGVAGDPAKVAPLLGALRGGFVNVVVTDENTAHQVLDLADQSESAGG